MSASENLKTVMKNDKQRTIVISLAVVVILMLVVGFFFATRTNNANKVAVNSVTPAGNPNIQNIPGNNPSAEYNKAIQDNNLKKSQEALKNQQSVDLTLAADRTGSRSAIDAVTDAENERRRREAEAQKPAEVVVVPPTPVVVQLAQEPVVQQPVVVAPPPPAPVVKQPNYTPDQYALIAALSQSFKNKKSAIETDYTSGQNPSKTDTQTAGNATGTNGASGSATTQNENVLMKAGDILNAVLETAINSDEPSPVLARVVGGKYNGARAVCTVQRNGEKALVECKRLALPDLAKSVTVNLVAIDPTTTRSGLATSVDKHYFERYVIGLGAVFLKGYADALARQNTATAITGSGSVVVSTGQLSNGDIAKSGLGEVGKSIASDVKQDVTNTRPTVYVAAGTAIGLMATDDILVK